MKYMNYIQYKEKVQAFKLTNKYGVANIAGLFGLVLLLVVGAALAPTIANATGGSDIQSNGNFSAASKSIFNLMALVFGIVLIVAALGYLGSS